MPALLAALLAQAIVVPINSFLKPEEVAYLLRDAGVEVLLAGPWGLAFYLAHLLVSHIVLESVDYIQHYGLLRRRQAGEYERTGAEHSWDTYHFFSSYMTFRVGHHSHHHLAVQPYYLLAAEPAAPKLPVGYFWAIAVVLMPPWWRRVIHPRLSPGPLPAA